MNNKSISNLAIYSAFHLSLWWYSTNMDQPDIVTKRAGWNNIVTYFWVRSYMFIPRIGSLELLNISVPVDIFLGTHHIPIHYRLSVSLFVSNN